ncbi:MAG: glycosyltransferase family 4 protein, partial [Patescibacteria group bacterium]|nr:glycosyltransferase family 4 protein [Patescibacteria group bacterium]
VLISFMTSIDRLLSDDTAYQSLQKMGVKVMVAGCDGYMYKTPIYALFRQFINPRMIMPTLASIKASRRLDHVLAYSSKTADYFAGARFVPRNRISITGNAIDTSMLNRTYHELMAAGVVRVPNKIVYAGRLSTGKKPRLLVEAFAEVIKKFPDATLEFVGEGSERGPAEELAKRLGVDSAVTFVGGVYDDKLMAEHLARASLAVMPALGGLGFNSAMACGLPLVYTDADGTENELFKEPGLGWYFDGTKKDLVRMISIALASPERMHEYGDEGEKVIMQKYTIANMVEKYVSAINHANQKTS